MKRNAHSPDVALGRKATNSGADGWQVVVHLGFTKHKVKSYTVNYDMQPYTLMENPTLLLALRLVTGMDDNNDKTPISVGIGTESDDKCFHN